jgi:hypothetical protein
MSDLRISPSAIHTWELCNRRWWATYVEGFREGSTASQIFGTGVHKVLELYDREGKPIDGTTPEGLVAQAALPYLEPPKSGICEDEFKIDMGGWYFFGKADWLHPKGIKVVDYKTCSSFDWVKSDAQLREDPQALIYGLVALERQDYHEGGLPVDLRWLYLRTKGKAVAQPVDLTLTVDEIRSGIETLARTVEEKIFPAKQVKFLDLTPNTASCHAFGKACPHRHRCTDLGFTSIFNKDNMIAGKDDLLAELKAKAMGATPPPKVETKAETQTGDDLDSLLSPQPTQAEANPAADLDDLDALLGLGKAPEPEPTPEPLPEVVSVTSKPEPGDTQPLDQVPQVRRRGRPPGSKNKAKEAPAPLVVETIKPLFSDPPTVPPELEGKVILPEARASVRLDGDTIPLENPITSGSQPIFTLYVDCLPIRDDMPSMASYFFSTAQKTVEQELGVPHYSLLEFGKGRGAFCVALKDALNTFTDNCQDPTDLFVDTRTPEGKDSLETLISLSVNVVRGL